MAAGDTLAGLDPKSGSELWKGVGGNLLVWSKGGRERMVTYGGHGQVTVSCVDPKTGNVCWKADTPYTTSAGTVVHPVLSQDMLVGFEVKVTANVSAEAKVVCYRLGDNGMEQAWSAPAPVPMTDTYGLTIANGHVYVDGERETSCLRLADGQKVASVAGVGGARTQVAFYADGRLFIQPEGRHGGQSFFMLNADPGSFRRLGADTPAGGKHPLAGQWHPPHPHDTAYANQPVSYPVVDGRIFIRGHDGLYCYDLRKQAK
jgi:outer membrane protein assembly factor BamB